VEDEEADDREEREQQEPCTCSMAFRGHAGNVTPGSGPGQRTLRAAQASCLRRTARLVHSAARQRRVHGGRSRRPGRARNRPPACVLPQPPSSRRDRRSKTMRQASRRLDIQIAAPALDVVDGPPTGTSTS
jgi:hypothetical protein